MKKLYVFGKSKKALNKRLLNKEEHIIGKEYNIFNPEGYETSHNLKQLKQDTIIAIYNKTESNPEPHCWGIYKTDKGIII